MKRKKVRFSHIVETICPTDSSETNGISSNAGNIASQEDNGCPIRATGLPQNTGNGIAQVLTRVTRHAGQEYMAGGVVPASPALRNDCNEAAEANPGGYRLQWTKKLFLPVEMMGGFSYYVVDVEERTLVVMDPTETSIHDDEMSVKHKVNANLVLRALRRCLSNHFAD